MIIDKLIEARFERRYKRFLADVVLGDGDTITVHCPNPGSMKGCLQENARVFLKDSNNPKRKLRFTWTLIELDSSLVIVDTGFANKFVKVMVEQGKVQELLGYNAVYSEPKYGDSRFDLLLTNEELSPKEKRAYKPKTGDCFVEIKSTTLKEDSIAMFPDAKTERGRKHLQRLESAKSEGIRAVQFYLVTRQDTGSFQPAKDIDPAYAQSLKTSSSNGVEVVAYDLNFHLNDNDREFKLEVELGKQLPIQL